MLRKKAGSMIIMLLNLMVFIVIMAGADITAYAEEKTASVSSVEEFSEALKDKDVNHIIVTESFDVPCDTATKDSTSFFVINRSMKIEGADSDIILKRTVKEGAENGYLQSMMGICGNGVPGDVQVSLHNIILDGGAVWGTYTGMERVNNKNKIIALGSSAGRSLIDVYNKGTINLEAGLLIQNSYTTYSLSSTTGDSGSYNYGGAIRVDFDHTMGGGTVNVKANSIIRDTSAAGDRYGGALGAYSYANLNLYGGLIENCSAKYGGAIGCTRRSGHDANVSGVFKMYGGTIRNCSAVKGGAICASGGIACQDDLLGGNIIDCTADYGAAAVIGVDNANYPTFNLTPYSTDGPLQISGCISKEASTSASTVYEGFALGYEGLYLGNSPNVSMAAETVSVNFKKHIDDEEDYTKLTIKVGASFGESFPADPTEDGSIFLGWNTKADWTGDIITATDKIVEPTTLYARWLQAPTVETSSDISAVYGETDKSISVDAEVTYGGTISYQWYSCGSDGSDKKVLEGETAASYSIPKLDAGKYSYVCVVTNTCNKKSLSTTSDIINVDISAKSLDVTWTDTEFEYDGNIKKPSADIVGVLESDDCNAEVYGEETEPGEYTASVKLAGKDSENYVIPEDKASVKFTIREVSEPTPSCTPTVQPTEQPTGQPTEIPTEQPTEQPVVLPTEQPSATPTASPATEPDKAKDDPYAESISVEDMEKTIINENTDQTDAEGSTHKYLYTKIGKVKKNSLKLSWKKIKDADGYIIYGAKCGKKLGYLTKIENPSKTAYTVKKLKKNTYYKYVVVAYKKTADGDKVITTSRSVHAATAGGKKGNPVSLKLKKSKISIKVGKTAKIKASMKKSKKVNVHIAKYRYESLDESIATVDKNGKVKGISKGNTKIIVYTQNGICKKVNIKVK